MTKSIVAKYKGWIITLSLGIAFAVLTNYQTVRQISTNYLLDLVNKKEIIYITIVKNRLAIRDRYSAEITLTPAALKRYRQHDVTFSSAKIGPHFIVFAGSSINEVNQWEKNLNDKSKYAFSVKKSY